MIKDGGEPPRSCEKACRKIGPRAIMMLSNKREKFKLEQGQKRLTRKVPQIQSLYYEERVAHLSVTTKPERRYDYLLDVFREEKYQGRGKDYLSKRIILT